jgi:hypothetical protein
MKMTKTKSTSGRDGLLREIESSLQAEMMRQIIRDNDSNCNLDTLRYYERIHTLHGKADFDTFSHRKSILKKSNWLDIPLRYPPYKNRLALLKKLMG